MATAFSTPPGVFTVFLVRGIATKRMRWKNGSEVAIDPAPNPTRGTYRVEVASSVDELWRRIEQLSTSEVLMWAPSLPGRGVITKSERANQNGSAPASTIARTRGYFRVASAAGWLMLDFDHVQPGATLESLREALISAAPVMADIPMLAMSSASANIYHKGTR